jgi:hypothetical protein
LTDRFRPAPLRIELLGVVALLAATSPVFFSLYRSMIFDTIPRDDYASYVLACVGKGDLVLPFPYRVLSIAPAALLFRLLPSITFTNAPDVDADYARATEALAMTSYLAMVAASVLLYRLATRSLGCSPAAALVGCLLTYFAFAFTANYGVDPMSIAMLTVMICLLPRRGVFAVAMIPAMFVNEKVPFILACVLFARGLWSSPRFGSGRMQLASALASTAIYLGLREMFPKASNATELQPGVYVANALSTIRDNLSLKGVELTLVPCVLIAAGCLVARKSYRKDWVHLKPADLVVFPFMLVLALCINARFTVGRDVMHGFPFLLPVLAKALDDASTRLRAA